MIHLLAIQFNIIIVTPYERHGITNYQQFNYLFKNHPRLILNKTPKFRFAGHSCGESIGDLWSGGFSSQRINKRENVPMSRHHQSMKKRCIMRGSDIQNLITLINSIHVCIKCVYMTNETRKFDVFAIFEWICLLVLCYPACCCNLNARKDCLLGDVTHVF